MAWWRPTFGAETSRQVKHVYNATRCVWFKILIHVYIFVIDKSMGIFRINITNYSWTLCHTEPKGKLTPSVMVLLRISDLPSILKFSVFWAYIRSSTLSLTSGLGGGWVVNTTPRPLSPWECIRGWVGPRAGVDVGGKSRSHRNSISRR